MIRADRAKLESRLAGIQGVEAFASDANFLLLRVGDAGAVWRGLLENGVLVKDVGRMHPLLAGCLRVTVGTPQENDALVEALERVLER